MEKEHTNVGTDSHGVDDYKYVFTDNRRTLSIERNFAANNKNWNKPRNIAYDGAFYIKIVAHNSSVSVSLTDEEMQELFYAYLALRKDYEDAQR